MPFTWTFEPARGNWSAAWLGAAGDVAAEVPEVMAGAPFWRVTLRRNGAIVGIHETVPSADEGKALAGRRLGKLAANRREQR
ncbi:MAG TPA: hypothetical protein VF796_12315 [Humisphaera sp.]